MAHYQNVTYMFIDGGYFDSVLEKVSKLFFKGEPVDIDYAKLKGTYKRAFYYNSLPAQRVEEDKEEFKKRFESVQRKYMAISEIHGFHVREGVVRRESKKNKQKKVDILMAVDMLMHTMAHNMDSVIILTGDLDFQPAIDALVQAGMYTNLLYFPDNTSKDLVSSADVGYKITIDSIRQWCTDEFINRFTFPRIQESRFPLLSESAKVIKRGKFEDGKELTYYQDDNKYVITFQSIKHLDPEVITYCNDLDATLLENYVYHKFGKVEWD